MFSSCPACREASRRFDAECQELEEKSRARRAVYAARIRELTKMLESRGLDVEERGGRAFLTVGPLVYELYEVSTGETE